MLEKLGSLLFPDRTQRAVRRVVQDESLAPHDRLELVARENPGHKAGQLARTALAVPASSVLARQAVHQATLAVLSAGPPGPLSQALAQVAVGAMEQLPQRTARAEVGHLYLSAIGEQGGAAGEQARNVIRIADLDPAAYQTTLNSLQDGPVKEKPPPSAGLHRSVLPGTDFFQYANGVWLSSIKSGSSMAMAVAASERLQDQIVSEALEDPESPPGSDSRLLGDFVRSSLDVEARNAAGLEPVAPLLKAVDELQSPDQLGGVVGQLALSGIPALIAAQSSIDGHGGYRTHLIPAGFGLVPDKAQYDKHGPTYSAWLGQLFEAAGDSRSQAESRARRVVALEKKFVAELPDIADYREARLSVLLTGEELARQAPGLDWAGYVNRLDLPQEQVGCTDLTSLQHLARVASETDLDTMKDFLRARVLTAAAPYLTEPTEESARSFYRAVNPSIDLGQTPRERALRKTRDLLPDLISRPFVERTVTDEDRHRIGDAFAKIKATFRESLERATWLSPETRAQALEKLDGIRLFVGGPPEWGDSGDLKLEPEQHFANVLEITRRGVRRGLDATDPTGALGSYPGLTPTETNAFYDPNTNAVMVLAGYLHPPVYSRDGDLASLYGSLGAVLGHELAHALDDQGAKFDAKGRLGAWWKPDDWQEFQSRVARVTEQAEKFDTGSRPMKGALVTGEASADLVGVRMAYEAFLTAQQGQPREHKDGLNPEQRFFVAFARYHASKVSPEFREYMLDQDPHPLSEFRVNQTLKNLPAFAAAFALAPTAAMSLSAAERAVIW